VRPLHLLSYGAAPAALAVLALAAPRPAALPPPARFDGDRAIADLRSLANGCTHRRPETGCHRRAAAMIAQQAKLAGLTVSEHRFEGGRNVIAESRGARPGVVVLAAHYDTVADSPGAADDASGVAAVLEVARTLQRWDRERRTIRYAFFDREEDGLLGSKAYVASLSAARRAEIEAALAVEMPGFRGGSPVLHTFRQPVVPPASLVGRVLAAAPEVDVGDPWLGWLYPLAARTVAIPFSADDAPFRAGGVPAAFYSDSSFSTFYAHYHRPTDVTSEIDPDALARAGDALLRIVADLAAGPPLPREAGAWLPLGAVVLGHNALVALAILLVLPMVFPPAGHPRLAAWLVAGACAAATWLDPVVAVVLVAPMAYTSCLGWLRFLGLTPTLAYVALLVVAARRLGRSFEYDGGLALCGVVAVAAVGLALHRRQPSHRRVVFPKKAGT
jgi:hypothetical protein